MSRIDRKGCSERRICFREYNIVRLDIKLRQNSAIEIKHKICSREWWKAERVRANRNRKALSLIRYYPMLTPLARYLHLQAGFLVIYG